MDLTIKATELLQLFVKANKLELTVEVNEDKDGDYVIKIYEYYDPANFDLRLVITKEGDSTWNKGDYSFDSAMNVLDEKLEEQEQKRIKVEKRKELIARLTPEERELLGL